MPKPIALWSGPRNVSTALMYYFAHRGDTRVWDEPLFGYFLKKTGVWRPSREEALQNMETDAEQVLDTLKKSEGKPFKFYKHMANHLEGLAFSICDDFQNVILCRQPKAVIASYTAHVDRPTPLDLCYEHQLSLLRHFEKEGIPFYILDSDELRKDPSAELSQLSDFLQMPFDESMLTWPVGAIDEDGIWAQYWYHNVHKSNGFAPYESKEYRTAPELQELLEQSQKNYQEILSYKR